MESKVIEEISTVLKDASLATFELLKILIPVSIIVKILKETDVIPVIGEWLAPVMMRVGLPGDLGLVWATTMITNIYGGLVVFFHLAQEHSLSVAQVTVLAMMMLLAHSLPVEVRITQKAGVRVWFMLLLRIGGAFLLGWLLFMVFSLLHLFQESNVLLWSPSSSDPSLLAWVWGEIQMYVMIFLIILILVTLMYILKKTGLINRLNTFLAPGLRVLGMSKNAAPITMIGITLGLAYGGGLIIREVQQGIASRKDAFLSLSLMGLCHSLIEDTLLMIAIGASLVGILFARVLFAIFIIILLAKFVSSLPENTFQRFFTLSKSSKGKKKLK